MAIRRTYRSRNRALSALVGSTENVVQTDATGLDSAATLSLINANPSIDSAVVTSIIDSAYVIARSSAGTDSATVLALIDDTHIFSETKIKSSKNYWIQSTEPTITDVDQYWYKSDSDILYKSVPSTTLTTTMPAVTVVSGSSPYSGFYDYPAQYPSSATRTNISGTDALGGTFTLGTTASAWFYFEGGPYPANPQRLNKGFYYTFDSAQDLRGIIIENSDPNAGRLERIDYEDGSYADNGFPGGGTVTFYNSNGTTMGKTASANTTGNTFVDISHPNGQLATKIGFSQVGDYYPSNDVFLFFAGGRIWEEIDRARTSSDLGLDSAAVTSLIDSSYINARIGAGTVEAIVDSAYIQLRDRFQDSAGIISIVDSAYVQARQSNVSGGGGVDSAATITLINSVIDSASRQFTYTYTATAGQTSFSGSDDNGASLAYSTGNILTFLNGILLVDSADYTATTGNSIVLNSAASLNDILNVTKFTSATSGSALSHTQYKYTTSTPATTFTGADDNSNTLSYDAGELQVHLNGILLVDSDDYTASNGTSVVLTSATDSNDVVLISVYTGGGSSSSSGGTDSATVISLSGELKGGMFRVNPQTLSQNVTIDSAENAHCAGPISFDSGVVLTINGNLVIS